jgi:hypothetical protein
MLDRIFTCRNERKRNQSAMGGSFCFSRLDNRRGPVALAIVGKASGTGPALK